MTIEKVKMIKTIQSGKDCWEAGEIYPKGGEPLHPTILEEIRLKTGTVEILSYKGDSVLAKSNLQQPLSDNTLVEAQRKEKEALEKFSLAKTRADQLLIEKREMIKAVEDLGIRFEVLSTKVFNLQNQVDTFEKGVPKNVDTRLNILYKRVGVLEEESHKISKLLAEMANDITNVKKAVSMIDLVKTVPEKESTSSKKTSGRKVLVKRTIVQRKK